MSLKNISDTCRVEQPFIIDTVFVTRYNVKKDVSNAVNFHSEGRAV